MKKLLTRTTAVVSSMVLTVCGGIGNFTGSAADDAREYTVIFDFGVVDTSELEPEYRTDGKLSDVADFASYKTTSTNIIIPMGVFSTKDYGFSGWTFDGHIGYNSGETFLLPEDYDSDTVVVKAVWYGLKDTRISNMKYNVEYEGEQVERPAWLKDVEVVPGMIYEPNYTRINIDGAFSHGLTDGTYNYSFGTKIVVPDHDVVFTPIWYKEVNFTFFAGDVDRLNGNDTYTFPKSEGSKTELAASDRFSRNGFNLVGWVSDHDGKTYKVGETVEVPGVDVIYTAVWEPKKYTVLFKTGNGGTNLKVPGSTDSAIICPEPSIETDGKRFVGWKDSDGVIYEAGSEYIIKGALPGSGISLTGVWESVSAPIVTTTSAPVTTVTTTTESVDVSKKLGDVNLDGVITIADATAVLQAIGNPDKYGLSGQALINADCYDPGDGLTGLDALAIQKLEANVIPELPEIPEK